MWGLLIAGGVAALVGGIAAWKWGDARVAEAAETGKGKADMWRYLPWAVVAVIIAAVVVVGFLAWKKNKPMRGVVG